MHPRPLLPRPGPGGVSRLQSYFWWWWGITVSNLYLFVLDVQGERKANRAIKAGRDIFQRTIPTNRTLTSGAGQLPSPRKYIGLNRYQLFQSVPWTTQETNTKMGHRHTRPSVCAPIVLYLLLLDMGKVYEPCLGGECGRWHGFVERPLRWGTFRDTALAASTPPTLQEAREIH